MTDQITERAEYLAEKWSWDQRNSREDLLKDLVEFSVMVRRDEIRRIRKLAGLPVSGAGMREAVGEQ